MRKSRHTLKLIIKQLQAEHDKYKEIVEKHDLCHNLEGKVDAEAFAESCADSSVVMLFGYDPHADALAQLTEVELLNILGKELSISTWYTLLAYLKHRGCEISKEKREPKSTGHQQGDMDAPKKCFNFDTPII